MNFAGYVVARIMMKHATGKRGAINAGGLLNFSTQQDRTSY